ncbi:MAG TPA: hypothetical protein VHZ25_05280 [Acidobacteriaceae bacterium]|nr:hypothetical protein [Acidobacteriaceae bacterium]
MRPWVRFIVFGLAVPLASAQAVQPVLTTAEAAKHVGENRTVCGDIVNEHTASSAHGAPLFIDIDQPYPNQIFDLVIWGDNKDDVGKIPEKGKVCASGQIILYKGRPEILLRDWHSWYVPQ